MKCIGPSLYQSKCDIVQFGLQEPETSFIYNESYKISKTNGKSYFYYEWDFYLIIFKLFCCIINIFSIRPSQNCPLKPYICIVRDKIECAIFGKKHDEIIIGTESGSIKVRRFYH